MYFTTDERIREEAQYIIENNATVRQTATVFGMSKSNVHVDMTKHLKSIDYKMYEKVRTILDKNKAERHIRGGTTTKKRYSKNSK